MKKTMMTLMACLLCALTATAQDVCYLVGTDGKMEAGEASVMLQKESDGVFKAEVTFSEDCHEFFIATALGQWEHPDEVESFCYGPVDRSQPVMPGQALTFGLWKDIGPMTCFMVAEATATMGGGGSSGGFEYNKAYNVTVDFNQRMLLVSEIGGGGDPDDPDDEDDGTSTSSVVYRRRNDLAFAFSSMKTLKQIKLPKTLPGLGEGILENCEVLEKVTFPDAATYIDHRALLNESGGFFGGLRKTLKGVDLPTTITKLGKEALRGVGFRTIDVSQFTELGDGCLRETNITEVTLNSSIKAITAGMFSGCNRLQSVTIPATIETIGDEAFKGCERLTNVTFAGQVEAIGKEAFSDCRKLSSIRINAKTIGERAFTSCSLTSVEIADGAKVIGPFAFSWNSRLASVTAPQTLEEIGSHAFQGWGVFGEGVYDTPFIANLPAEDGVKYIGSVAYLFMGGDELKVKEGTLGVADEFLTNHTYLYDGSNSWGASAAFNGWTAPTTVTLPSTLRVLGTFDSPNTTTLQLPASLVKIKGISGDKLRGSITIPASVEYLGSISGKFTRIYYNAVDAEFDGQLPTTLTRAILGEGVKTIPVALFSSCTDLSGALVGGIYITLDTEDGIAAASADGANDLTVKNQLQGLVFEIPAGKGKITVDCQTLGSRVLFVKIGADEPKQVQLGTRGTMTFHYDVAEVTRVFIYAADGHTSARPGDQEVAPRRTAYANDDSVKFYGLSIEVDDNTDGVDAVRSHGVGEPVVVYDLQGRRIAAPRGGLYIVNGLKRVVK